METASASNIFPLTFASRGEVVEIADVRSGARHRQRLGELGLYTGMSERVVQEAGDGPVILAIKHDARLAVGRGMAQRIWVRLITRSE